jgi:pyridoxal phosphate-dependent aminotransferase EpsN
VTPQQLIAALDEHNIEARPVWKPLHLQPLFDDCGYFPHDAGMSVAEDLFRTGLCLPSGSGMTDDEQERVIRCIRSVFAKAGELAVSASFYSHGA